MGIFSHHTSCPNCGSRDNRAVYKDGGSWCFGCGKSSASSVSGFVTKEYQEEKSWSLPTDLTQDFPKEVVNYALTYSIKVPTLISCNYYWGAHSGRLWRLFQSEHDKQSHSRVWENPSSAEARICSIQLPRARTSPKVLFYGNKEDTYAIYSTEATKGTKHLVLTEDSFSSIVVGSVCPAMPLFGTTIPTGKVAKLSQDYQRITVWLDHDKFKEAWEIAMKFKWLGCRTNVVLTKLDPKFYSELAIKEYLV